MRIRVIPPEFFDYALRICIIPAEFCDCALRIGVVPAEFLHKRIVYSCQMVGVIHVSKCVLKLIE